MRFGDMPEPLIRYREIATDVVVALNRMWRDGPGGLKKFSELYPDEAKRLGSIKGELDQRAYDVSRSANAVGVFVANRTTAISELQEALSLLEKMVDFTRVHGEAVDRVFLKSNDTVVATRQEVERLEVAVNRLGKTHATMHNHICAVTDEYLEEFYGWREFLILSESFYADLFAARNAYFETPSDENLRWYICVAQELSEKPNPIEALAQSSDRIVHTPVLRDKATALLEDLICDELMVELLQDREELSHVE